MSYTVTSDETDFHLNEKERVAAVLQNVALLLATAQGTAPMHREFGLPTEVLDLPMPAARVRLAVEIKDAINRFEPRAQIRTISFDENAAAEGKLRPVLEVEILEE